MNDRGYIDLKEMTKAKTKQVESKAPESKVPESKAPEPKAPESKASEPKAPEPKASGPKTPEPKVSEPKASEPKAPHSKAKVPAKPKRRVKKKKNKAVRIISIIILCVVFIWCAIEIYNAHEFYNKGEAENFEITKLALDDIEIDVETENYWDLNIDFETLLEMNEEIIAWLHFPAPSEISYAVVQTNNNSYYLDHSVTKESNNFGAIFMDMDNSYTYEDANTILYGHNMKNGSMFGTLKDYKDEEYYKENPHFYIYTAEGIAIKYAIMTVQEVDQEAWQYQKDFDNAAKLKSFLEKSINGSYYNTGHEIPEDINIVTLSTCTTVKTDRLIVQGVKVDEYNKNIVEQEELQEQQEENIEEVDENIAE